MELINILSLVSWVAIASIFISGVIEDSKDLKYLAFTLFVINAIFHIGFQAGAEWQKIDCQENYKMIPLIKKVIIESGTNL